MGYIHWHGPRQQGDKWIPCSECNGAGMDYSRDGEPTDRAALTGETPAMAFRGYLPTNLCHACGGEGGYWQPPQRPFRNSRRWPSEQDRQTNSNVLSLGQCWHADKGFWNPPMTAEMRAGFVCEYADDVTPPQEDAQ